MSDASLARIPFQRQDELMIVSMARWMRFIGVIKVVGSLATILLVLIGMIFFDAILNAELAKGDAKPVTVSVNGKETKVPLEKIKQVVADNRLVFGALALFGLILGIAGVILGVTLCHAGDDFDRVARTDVADQDYVAAGIAQLTTYFKVSILLGVATLLVAITAGISMAAKYSVAP